MATLVDTNDTKLLRADSDQTDQMRRLIWVFVGRPRQKLILLLIFSLFFPEKYIVDTHEKNVVELLLMSTAKKKKKKKKKKTVKVHF